MTLDKAREMLLVQAGFGGFYNGNSAKLILAEVNREHSQEAVDRMIRECELDRVFGFESGTHFGGGLAFKPKKKNSGEIGGNERIRFFLRVDDRKTGRLGAPHWEEFLCPIV